MCIRLWICEDLPYRISQKRNIVVHGIFHILYQLLQDTYVEVYEMAI